MVGCRFGSVGSLLGCVFVLYTVDSLLFEGYQFLWNSLVQVNHEFKYSTNWKFAIGLYAEFGKSTKLNVFLNPKNGIHENK